MTIDEVRRTLKSYERTLSEVPVSPQVGAAALELEEELSGIARKYLDAVKSAKQRVTLAQYLGPYLEDLVTVLRSKGVELYNENTDALAKSQPVVDDILEQQDFEQQRHYGSRAKSYATLRHDVTLWHLAHRERPKSIDSPLDAVFWIATLDYRFLGFDAYKRRETHEGIPLCVHPTVLIQMLQFWVPRNAELDAALFDSLGALLPHTFDSDAETMCLRIIGALSRFERVDDLPAETVTSILVNRALRARLNAAPSVEAQLTLVRDAIVEEVAASKRAFAEEKRRAEALQRQLERLTRERDAATATIQTTAAQHKASTAALSEQLQRERSKQSDLAEKVELLQRWIEEEKQNRMQDNERFERRSRYIRQRTIVISGLLILGAVLIAAGWQAAATLEMSGLHRFKSRMLATTAGVAVWMVAFWCCGLLESFSTWNDYSRSRKAVAWAAGIMGSLFLTFVGNTLWDLWKQ